MSEPIEIDYIATADVAADKLWPGAADGGSGIVVVFAGADGAVGSATQSFLGEAGKALVAKASASAKFKGKAGQAVDVIAPAGLAADRLVVVGVGDDGKEGEGKAPDFATLGGAVAGRVGRGSNALVLFDTGRDGSDTARAIADFVLGLRLRDYRFDLYKTRKKEEDGAARATRILIAVSDVEAARAAVAATASVADGVVTARSLVNEPANVLYPESFAERARVLESLGVEVTILDVPAMEALGMGAILGVSQGSVRPGRIVVMRWNGAAAEARPVAFIGKGVTFDTGGISIKPAGGMEDMKGDMAGAACVVGLMQALAGRKAKVNVVGAIGLVENMPGPNAQRPGDIVRSMSGQTIEIINTDAEGRLVLADVVWYVQDKYKPVFMIDLATLTGAILIALGQEYAGLFSNNDALSERLAAAGAATGEKVWRMPLGPSFDKLIDSKFADMKNTGGRHAGSITAAQFIGRFVNDTPWAHLDIAGMGMASPASEINQSWGSGWGVRLLDRLVADHYEAG